MGIEALQETTKLINRKHKKFLLKSLSYLFALGRLNQSFGILIFGRPRAKHDPAESENVEFRPWEVRRSNDSLFSMDKFSLLMKLKSIPVFSKG